MDKRKELGRIAGGATGFKMENVTLLKAVVDDVEENMKFIRDNQHLTGIFSAKLWQRILEEVKSTDDLASCSNASPFFRELLRDRRVLFLFPKVVESFAPRYELYKDDCYDEDKLCLESGSTRRRRKPNIEWRDPHVRNPSGILKCRLVCSTWNKGVEDFYQGPLAGHYDLWSNFGEEPSRLALHTQTHLKTWANDHFSLYYLDPNEFLDHFDNTHCSSIAAPLGKNPLIRRFVSFYIILAGTETGIAKDLVIARRTAEVNMLKKYGKEVWYCNITTNSSKSFHDHVEYYIKLREMVELMPNLKVLYLFSCFYGSGVKDGSILRQHEALLEEEMAIHPFPKLDKLELLKAAKLPATFFNEISRRNSHVSTLQLYCEAKFEMVPSELLSNLKYLNIYVKSFSEEDYQKLMENGAGWKLEKLYMLCPFVTTRTSWPFFFEQLSYNWAASLTNLVVQLPTPGTNFSGRKLLETTRSYRLELPCLETLKLIVGTPIALDFLLPSKDSLKYLEIVRVHELSKKRRMKNRQLLEYLKSVTKTEKKKQIVQFIGYKNWLLESNIWKIFGKLKMVRVSRVDTDIDGVCSNDGFFTERAVFMRPTKILI